MSLAKIEKNQKRAVTLTGDEPIAMRLYIKAPQDGYAYRATKAADTWTFESAPDGTTFAVEASIGTAGVINSAAASYDTIGELKDAIEADTDGIWGCVLVDTEYGADATDMVDFSQSAVTAAGLDVKWDVSALNVAYLSIGPEAEGSGFGNAGARISSGNLNFSNLQPDYTSSTLPYILTDRDDTEKRMARVARLRRITATLGDSASAAEAIQVYSASQSAETALGPATVPTEDTEKVIDYTADNNWLQSNLGERILVKASSAGTFDGISMVVEGDFGDPASQIP